MRGQNFKMIIKFYDNENYDYPLIDIWKEDFKKFEKILKKYQKDEEYNFDVLKDNENEELSKEEIFDRIKLNYYTEEDFEKELIKLLEDGFIFEAKPNKFRWLG